MLNIINTTLDFLNQTNNGFVPITYCIDWCKYQHWNGNYQGVIILVFAFFALVGSQYARQTDKKVADLGITLAQLLIIGFFIWLMLSSG